MAGKKKQVKNSSTSAGLKITNGRKITSVYLNNFFNLFSTEQIHAFNLLFIKLSKPLGKLRIDGDEFMKQVLNSYRRYQEFKKIDPFIPMDKKGLKYVIAFMEKAIKNTTESFDKENQRSKF